METLIINIPEKKSTLVKQILRGLGVTIQPSNKIINIPDYKQKLAEVSTWTNDDLKIFEENKKAFESLKPQQW
jgi:hypothetical protein